MGISNRQKSGDASDQSGRANFMVLLTVGVESALTVMKKFRAYRQHHFHGLARNVAFCACVFRVTKDSVLIAKERNIGFSRT